MSVDAITKEEDTIDGRTDYWVYIKDDKGRTEWMFGGYGTIERGGSKYQTPANRIRDSVCEDM